MTASRSKCYRRLTMDPAEPAPGGRNRLALALGLLGGGVGLEILSMAFGAEPLLWVGIPVSMAGLGLYLRHQGRSLAWCLVALWPIAGPLLGLAIRAPKTPAANPGNSAVWGYCAQGAVIASVCAILGAVVTAREGPAFAVFGLVVAIGYCIAGVGVKNGWKHAPGLPIGLGVVAGLLSCSASIPFLNPGLVRKADESSSVGSLGAVRSALSAWYGDFDGAYPDDLARLTQGGKYLPAIPLAKTPPYHPPSKEVSVGATAAEAVTDRGGWAYVASPKSEDAGWVMVNCTHTDTKGSVWTSY